MRSIVLVLAAFGHCATVAAVDWLALSKIMEKYGDKLKPPNEGPPPQEFIKEANEELMKDPGFYQYLQVKALAHHSINQTDPKKGSELLDKINVIDEYENYCKQTTTENPQGGYDARVLHTIQPAAPPISTHLPTTLRSAVHQSTAPLTTTSPTTTQPPRTTTVPVDKSEGYITWSPPHYRTVNTKPVYTDKITDKPTTNKHAFKYELRSASDAYSSSSDFSSFGSSTNEAMDEYYEKKGEKKPDHYVDVNSTYVDESTEDHGILGKEDLPSFSDSTKEKKSGKKTKREAKDDSDFSSFGSSTNEAMDEYYEKKGEKKPDHYVDVNSTYVDESTEDHGILGKEDLPSFSDSTKEKKSGKKTKREAKDDSDISFGSSTNEVLDEYYERKGEKKKEFLPSFSASTKEKTGKKAKREAEDYSTEFSPLGRSTNEELEEYYEKKCEKKQDHYEDVNSTYVDKATEDHGILGKEKTGKKAKREAEDYSTENAQGKKVQKRQVSGLPLSPPSFADAAMGEGYVRKVRQLRSMKSHSAVETENLVRGAYPAPMLDTKEANLAGKIAKREAKRKKKKKEEDEDSDTLGSSFSKGHIYTSKDSLPVLSASSRGLSSESSSSSSSSSSSVPPSMSEPTANINGKKVRMRDMVSNIDDLSTSIHSLSESTKRDVLASASISSISIHSVSSRKSKKEIKKTKTKKKQAKPSKDSSISSSSIDSTSGRVSKREIKKKKKQDKKKKKRSKSKERKRSSYESSSDSKLPSGDVSDPVKESLDSTESKPLSESARRKEEAKYDRMWYTYKKKFKARERYLKDIIKKKVQGQDIGTPPGSDESV